jgi:hypothetical protein
MKQGGDIMNVIHKKPDKYGLQKEGKVHRIVKIIREYDNQKEAERDLVKLLTGQLSEELLLGKENDITLKITKVEANLFRQWYNAVIDLNPTYFSTEDELLYRQIQSFLREG